MYHTKYYQCQEYNSYLAPLNMETAIYLKTGVYKFFQKRSSHLQIRGPRRVTWGNFYNEDSAVCEWPVNFTGMWRFLLGACELTRFFYVRRKNCNIYADIVRCLRKIIYLAGPPSAPDVCTPALNVHSTDISYIYCLFLTSDLVLVTSCTYVHNII